MDYETKQAILEEAGLSQIVNGEVLAGLADGTNKVFNTTYKPIGDSNDDDYVGVTDVTVYVNGLPAPVSALKPTTGTITLTTAPAVAATVTCDYRYSNVSDAYVERVREEAQAWINDAMDAIDTVPYEPVPPTIRKLTRMYAAAQLLIKEYGFNHDTGGTSKDGFKKMEMLVGVGQVGKPGFRPGLLDRYIAIGGASGLSDVSAAEVDVYAEPDLFAAIDASTGYTVSVDDAFMRDFGPGEFEDPPWSR